jgi:hypothetical protein
MDERASPKKHGRKMEKKIIELKIKDIPQAKLDKATESIEFFSTVLIHNGQPWGSATFVKCQNKYGLLTAHHVAKSLNLRPNSNENLGLAINNQPHALIIEFSNLKHYKIGIPLNDENGPDIAFIEILDSEKLGWIKAYRSFCDISSTTTKTILETPVSNTNSLWAIAGMPEEFSEKIESQNVFKVIWDLKAQAFFGGVEKYFEMDGFDYIDLKANYNTKDELPKSFGGISGGGLWRVPMSMSISDINTLKLGEPELSGLVFYQTQVTNNCRILRCHGPKSIYNKLSKLL